MNERKLFLIIIFIIFRLIGLSQISVFTNFEGGNAEVISISDSSNSIIIYPELKQNNTTRCWFYFGVTNFDKNKQLSVAFQYDNAVHSPNYPVYSFDKKNWLSIKSADNGITKEVSSYFVDDTVYFAAGYPYLYSDLIEFTKKISLNKRVKTDTLTISEGGRFIPYFKITDFSKSDSLKQTLLIISRQHAFESLSNYSVEGMIEMFLSNNLTVESFLKHNIVYVVPMVDVDNVAAGASGRMQYPIDFNRDWNPVSHWNATNALKSLIKSISEKNSYRIFIDVHSTFPGSDSELFSYFDIYGKDPESHRLNTFWDFFENISGYRASRIIHTLMQKGLTCADQYNHLPNCNLPDFPCHKSMFFSFTLECDWNLKSDGTNWTQSALHQMGMDFALSLIKYIAFENNVSY